MTYRCPVFPKIAKRFFWQIKRNKLGRNPYDLNNHGMSKYYTNGTPYDLNVAGFSKKNKSL